jgi:hypothetical protein
MCAACGASPLVRGGTMQAAQPAGARGGRRRPKVRLIFCEAPNDRPIWPNIGYDFEARRGKLLELLQQGCPEVEFLPVAIGGVGSPGARLEAEELLKRDAEVDGYLAWILGLTWQGAPLLLSTSGKPTLLVDDLYAGCGEFLTQLPTAMRSEHPVEWVSSGRLEDVVESARSFALLSDPEKNATDFVNACRAARRGNTKKPGAMRCRSDNVAAPDWKEALARLSASPILVVGGGNNEAFREAAAETLGVKLVPVSFQEMSAAYDGAEEKTGAAFAERWMHEAQEVVEPSREEIARSGRMHAAMETLMRRHDARGITVNCLGGFYGGHLKAYPCLGFSQLNNDGFVGGCEADQMSALTMMVGTTLFGRPGFISDPVIDTSRHEIIYAHCVAPTRVFGPEGSSNPYRLRDHSEDRKGASLQSLMPSDYLTTTLEINPASKSVLMHQARTTRNVDEDKACRTKLAGELVGDIEKLTENWGWGWHRVTFYGDLKPHMQEFCERFGFKLIEEA